MPVPHGIAVTPTNAPAWLAEAVRRAGAEPVDVDSAVALLWYGQDPEELRNLLKHRDSIRWVQIAWAGVERYRHLMRDGRLWTCAKAVYGENVAAHALALILASFREIPRFARDRRWAESVGRSLFGARVTIVGAGGITRSLLELLKPFRVTATVVRRKPHPIKGAFVVANAELESALHGADVVVLACALTDETAGMIGLAQLEAMERHTLLVNVARGQLVRTDDLVSALRAGTIGAAALDVTDPEPLPDEHPLWGMENVIITPHSANPDELGQAPLAQFLVDNVSRFVLRRPLRGRVDVDAGY